mgnify:CR=1 FL=1
MGQYVWFSDFCSELHFRNLQVYMYRGPPLKQLKSQIWPNVTLMHLQRSTIKTIEKSNLAPMTAAIA